MKSLMLGAAASLLIASSAFAGSVTEAPAEDTTMELVAVGMSPAIGGSIEVEIAENAAGDFAATTTFEAGIIAHGLAFGEIGVESIDGNTFEVNKWYIGTVVGPAAISFGDHDGGVFVESYSDYSNILEPAIGEALIVTSGDLALAVGFTDIGTDITDLSNVQGSYTISAGVGDLTTSADYNLDSEDYALAARLSGVDVVGVELGSTVSYGSAAETFAYEVDGTIMGATAYLNGDQDDALQNIGIGYERGIGSLTLASDINYNIDTEELSPSMSISFSF